MISILPKGHFARRNNFLVNESLVLTPFNRNVSQSKGPSAIASTFIVSFHLSIFALISNLIKIFRMSRISSRTLYCSAFPSFTFLRRLTTVFIKSKRVVIRWEILMSRTVLVFLRREFGDDCVISAPPSVFIRIIVFI